MSKNNEVIYDITENFADAEFMVELSPIIVLMGDYSKVSGNRIELGETDIYLEYDYISYIQDVKWNNYDDYSKGGISIIKIKNGMNRVPLNDKLDNFEFLYFDFVSTNSIGAISFPQTAQANSNNLGIDTGNVEKSGSEDFSGFTKIRLLKKVNDDIAGLPLLLFEKDKKKVMDAIGKGADLIYMVTVTGDFPDKKSPFKRGDIFYNVFKKKEGHANKKLSGSDFQELPENDKAMIKYLKIDLFEKEVVEKFSNNNVRAIEVCKSKFKDFSLVNRSSIFVGNNNCQVFYTINGNFLKTKAAKNYKGILPNFYTICIDTNKKIDPPFCPSKYNKCWVNNQYRLGYCYDSKTNTTFSTNCRGKECMDKESKKINNINTWWDAPGSGRKRCENPSDDIVFSKNNVDVNELSGMGIIDLNEDAKETTKLRNKIYNIQSDIEKQRMDLKDKEMQYKTTKGLVKYNKDIIEKKLRLLDNRNRQLELSIDRNIYWKKILYVLLALVILVIVILLFLSSIMKKD